MKKILSTIVLLLLAVVTLTACTNKQGSSKDKLRVVTTNSIIADITKNIAGDKITLHSIVPVGIHRTDMNCLLIWGFTTL